MSNNIEGKSLSSRAEQGPGGATARLLSAQGARVVLGANSTASVDTADMGLWLSSQ